MKNIFIISFHPAPYRDPVRNELVKNKDLNIKQVYLYGTDNGHLEWNYDNAAVYSKSKKILFLGDVHFGLKKLAKESDCVLVPAWYPISLFFLIKYLVKINKPFIFSCDTSVFKMDKKHQYLYKYIRKANSFYVPGLRTKNALCRTLNISSKKIFEGSYMINETEWAEEVKLHRKGKVSDCFDLLFVGKFVKNRNIPLLIDTLKLLRQNSKKIRLTIIGSGSFYNEIIEDYKKNDSEGLIYIKSVEYGKLAEYYANVDCYIHPGNEPYSLATVQGVIAGLPIISAYEVGAVDDYVKEGENGFIISDNKADSFKNAVMKIIDNLDLFKKKSEYIAKEKLKNRNVQYATMQLVEAIKLCGGMI